MSEQMEMNTNQAPNNAAVEIQRRKAILEARQKEAGADQAHRANVPLVEKKSAPTMQESRMKLAQYERQDWIANAEIHHTIDDILKPGYWAHMAAKLTAFDHIEVRAEDGSWVAYLLVIQADRLWAKVVLDHKIDLVSAEEMPSTSPEHTVEWKGPHRRFGVVRVSDQELIRADFHTKEEASQWMREHERTISVR